MSDVPKKERDERKGKPSRYPGTLSRPITIFDWDCPRTDTVQGNEKTIRPRIHRATIPVLSTKLAHVFWDRGQPGDGGERPSSWQRRRPRMRTGKGYGSRQKCSDLCQGSEGIWAANGAMRGFCLQPCAFSHVFCVSGRNIRG